MDKHCTFIYNDVRIHIRDHVHTLYNGRKRPAFLVLPRHPRISAQGAHIRDSNSIRNIQKRNIRQCAAIHTPERDNPWQGIHTMLSVD